MSFGSKIDAIHDLASHGIVVPQTLTVSAELQEKFFRINGLYDSAAKSLSKGRSPYADVLKALRDTAPKLPAETGSLISAAQNEFGAVHVLGIARSSAKFEDSAEQSFAGMFSSILFRIDQRQSLAKALIGVWISALRPHVLDYLAVSRRGQNPVELLRTMNVAIQPMIDADASGVLFSEVLDGEASARVLANYGAGELLNTLNVHQCELVESGGQLSVKTLTRVRHALRPHAERLSKPGDVLDCAKHVLTISQPYKSHISTVRLPHKLAARPCLSASHRAQLFDALMQIAELRGARDFEFEFVLKEDILTIVQLRPLTAYEVPQSGAHQLNFIVQGTISGPVHIWQQGERIEKGDVLAVSQLDYGLIAVLGRAGGVLTMCGSAHSHAAIICRELGVPVALISAGEFRNIRRFSCNVLDGTLYYVN